MKEMSDVSYFSSDAISQRFILTHCINGASSEAAMNDEVDQVLNEYISTSIDRSLKEMSGWHKDNSHIGCGALVGDSVSSSTLSRSVNFIVLFLAL